MEGVLPAARLPAPKGAAEDGEPVVGRRAVRARLGPNVPVGVWRSTRYAAIEEPGVTVRRMAPDHVDDNLEAERMGAGDERIEIRECPVLAVNLAVVGDIVPEICHRRGE